MKKHENHKTLLYANEKYHEAVHTLATHPGDVKARLRAASKYLVIGPASVPEKEDLRKDIEWISKQLTKLPPKGTESELSATLNRIKSKTATKIAERIYIVSFKLEKLCKTSNLSTHSNA